MKLLYIVPSINHEGGVARVLSIKTNYLIEKFEYQIHILTQNKGSFPLFYSFNENIVFHDLILKGNVFKFFNTYRTSLKKNVEAIKPDVIIVCDNGLKAYTIPFILKKNIPIILECHGSKYIEERKSAHVFFQKLKYKLKNFGAKRYTNLIALSNESLEEWNVKNGAVISNPCWLQTDIPAELKSKKVIVVARNSYEKGLDRLLFIWEKVLQKHPNWILDIYGKEIDALEIQAVKFGIELKVNFNQSIKNIHEKYLESSIYVMTSRTEGFPMVLIEAMASGLPCIAYDCPCGPRAIIKDNVNGFLIEDGNVDLFVEKLNLLIEDKDLRKRLGKKAQESVTVYDLDEIMKQWKILFESLVIGE
ncbi:glycosyltransferase family 4 protein [Flavobacterium sp. ZT3R17]|uniref:glycosyltransferase family 4 protein n=1 Tax=Flavobacterium cryoconiti TaxID=3398736 RepID=UPI003A846AF8